MLRYNLSRARGKRFAEAVLRVHHRRIRNPGTYDLDPFADDPHSSFGDQAEGKWVEPMLGGEYSRRKRCLIIAGMNRDDRLSDDRPGVEFRPDEMNRAAGKAHPSREGLPLRVKTAEGGEQ